MEEFNIINPYSLKSLATYKFETLSECEKKINALHSQFLNWKTQTAELKKEWLIHLANNLEQNKTNLANTITTDMGKPITEAIKEIEKCIECCKFYATKTTEIEKKLNQPNGFRSPIGIILGIMPWNFPLWQLIRFIVPAVIVGNGCIIKPAYNTYRIALALIACCPSSASIIDCIIPTDKDSSKLISNTTIAGVSFTGSVNVGRHIGQLAASNFKPCVLELGGSDPFIIFKDANLETAINTAVTARFSNAGQTCISAKRFLFEATIFDEAISLFKQKSQAYLNDGDPLNSATTIGPMARQNLKDNVLNQIQQAKLKKHNIIYKYTTKKETGLFVEPQIIDGRQLSPNNPLLTDEIFGPIATCNSFNSTKNAIQKANHTKFGLGASIWTNQQPTIDECIKSIDCGTIAVNKSVHSAFDTPFGGWKQSGIGVELGIEGALSFTRFKGVQ